MQAWSHYNLCSFHTSWFPETGSGHLKHCVGRRCKCYCLFQHSDPPPEIDQWHARPADLWPIGRGQQQVVHVQQQYGNTNWVERQMSWKRYSPLWSSALSREFLVVFGIHGGLWSHTHIKPQSNWKPVYALHLKFPGLKKCTVSTLKIDYKVWE